jgi:hypothetical protein
MPTFLVHVAPLEGMVRSQSLSPARLIFLITLVVFFTVLFVVTYVWMRKPGFGQHGGHDHPAVPRKAAAAPGQPTPAMDTSGGDDVAPSQKIDRQSGTALLVKVAP